MFFFQRWFFKCGSSAGDSPRFQWSEWGSPPGQGGAPKAETTKQPANKGRLSFGRGPLGRFSLELDGEGFGECEAEGGLGGEDNFFLPGVGRSRGSRTCT